MINYFNYYWFNNIILTLNFWLNVNYCDKTYLFVVIWTNPQVHKNICSIKWTNGSKTVNYNICFGTSARLWVAGRRGRQFHGSGKAADQSDGFHCPEGTCLFPGGQFQLLKSKGFCRTPHQELLPPLWIPDFSLNVSSDRLHGDERNVGL